MSQERDGDGEESENDREWPSTLPQPSVPEDFEIEHADSLEDFSSGWGKEIVEKQKKKLDEKEDDDGQS